MLEEKTMFIIYYCLYEYNECSVTGPTIDAQGHQRWGNGTLFDNMSIAAGHFALQNRSNKGSGQGWSAANDVLWNCISKNYLVENPPTAHNWAFGCQGQSQTSAEPQGIIVSPGQMMQPARSLCRTTERALE